MDLSKMKQKVESGMYASWNELMVGGAGHGTLTVGVCLSSISVLIGREGVCVLSGWHGWPCMLHLHA